METLRADPPAAPRFLRALPTGGRLSDAQWRARHHGILLLLALHSAGLAVFGVWRGEAPLHALAEAALVGAFGLPSLWPRLGRRAHATFASVGLITASAVLVHFAGGYIEAHFHFFVMLAVILLYQDWLPYAAAVAYVLLHHGVLGLLAPTAVFNHPGAFSNPWFWAGVHTLFVGGLATANIVVWRSMDRASAAQAEAERALRESEQRLRDIVENSTNLFYSHTAENRLTYVSPQSRHFFGCEPEEALVRWTEFATDDPVNAEGVRSTMRAIETGRRQAPYELELLGADGRRIRVEVNEAPVVREGRTVAIVGALTDVTGRRAAEQALREATRLNQDILDHVPVGVLHVDGEGRITYANARLLHILGGQDASPPLRGRSIFDIESLRPRADFLDLVRGLLRGESFSGHELIRHRTIYGRDVDVSVSGVPILREGPSGGMVVRGATLMVQDVSERRRAEEASARARERAAEISHLKAMDTFKTQFINAAAHELNTPLTPVRMQMHLLKMERDGPLPERQRRSIDILTRNFERYDRLVQDLLNAARYQAGRLGLTREPMDVGHALAEAARPFEDVGRQAGVAVRTRAPEGLLVEADRQRVAQVLDNLLSNALRFTREGGVVTVEARMAEGEVLVTVTDDGEGMDPALIPSLFQPFSQVHEPTKARGGSGLGLYICRGIVETHGGRIWCESEGRGKGARFAFTLPTTR